MFLCDLFLLENVDHIHEIHIVGGIFISSGTLIFSVSFLAWKALSFCVNHPNWFQSIWALFLLLRPWFPTCGISLLSGKLRSGSSLVSFYGGQTTHNLVLHLGKMSTHLIYFLIQEVSRIRSTAAGNLSLCFFLDTRVLKRLYPSIKEVLFNVSIVLFGLC
jgi:hypothetical protein